jgi:hypothetical protein
MVSMISFYVGSGAWGFSFGLRALGLVGGGVGLVFLSSGIQISCITAIFFSEDGKSGQNIIPSVRYFRPGVHFA